MRAFTHRPKAARQIASTKWAMTGRAHSVKGGVENSILHDFSRIPVYPQARIAKLELAVNTPEAYEQEADRVADQTTAPVVSGVPPRIQRFSGQSNGQTGSAIASVSQVLASSGKPLEPALRQDMEQRFGHDFSRVRVHFDAAAEQSAREMRANAYTVGNDVVFGASRFAPGTREGRRLLAHELTHVVQQTGALVSDSVHGPAAVDSITLQRQPAPTGPSIKDILRLDQTVPIKGLAKNQPNYIDHFRGNLASAPLGSDIILTPSEGPASKTGISIPKGDFYMDKDPLSGSSMGQNQVYKSRAVAEAVVSDLMKQTPGWAVYTYYMQDGIILPTTLSDTTIPNLMPFIRQQREQNMADLKATADLAKAVALWYVGARFPIKIRAGGPSGPAGGEAARQAEKEALKQAEKETAKQAEKESLKQEGKEVAKAIRKPPVQPSAPPGWKGTLNAFGKEIGWPAQGEVKVAAEAADLAKLRNAGVTQQWATEQAQIYREVARMNPSNPTAALRADWLAKIADRLRGAP
jgi:Domain of unknown function (DUF4157)